jgi:hypothetical protein
MENRMAILHRNPMPLSGALFVTNPRRKKKSTRRKRKSLKIPTRLNARKKAPTASVKFDVAEELNKASKRKSSKKKVLAKSRKKSVKAKSSKKVIASRKQPTRLKKWASFQKRMAGLGLTRSELSKLYKKGKTVKELTALKREINKSAKGLHKARKIGRRTYTKAKGQVQNKMPMLFNPLKKVGLRKNPILGVNILATPIALAQAVQTRLQTIPVLRTVAWTVTPIALGYGALKIHEMAKPYVVGTVLPAIASAAQKVAEIPVIGGVTEAVVTPVLAKANQYPYTSTAIAGGLTLGLLANKGYVSKPAAAMVAGAAATVGIVLDSLNQGTELGALQTNPHCYGDGGQYMIGQNSTALGRDHHMGAVQMGAIDMGAVQLSGAHMAGAHMAGAHDSIYGDASVADAKACTCVMMPDEVAAAKAGKMAYIRKFGTSPRNLKSGQSLMSRHAGRPGHRYGWIVKMLGFENFQKIASLPPKKRESVISQLQQQAIAAIPKLVAQQQAKGASVESASIPVHGTLNGVGGVEGAAYGALMFAGNGY